MRVGWPRDLSAQIGLTTLAALIFTQILFLALFGAERGLSHVEEQRADIVRQGQRLVGLLPTIPEPARNDVLSAAGSERVIFRLSDTPTVVAGTSDEDARMELGARGGSVEHPGYEPVAAFARRIGLIPAILRLSLPTSDGQWLNIEASLERPGAFMPPRLLLGAILSALAVWIVMRFLVARITLPLRQLAGTADALDLDRGPPERIETGPSEVKVLAKALHSLHARLVNAVHERTRILAALGHDLRSPITALRLQAEFVDEDQLRERITRILDEMQEMTETTLAYARGLSETGDKRSSDPFALVARLAEELNTTASPVTLGSMPVVTTPLRELPVRRAVRNLIENAQRYGEKVHVSGELDGSIARIHIDDDGPGIPPQDLQRVFSPFERLEASRSRDTGGHGLGLTIARDILRAQGGDVTLLNRAEGGLRATVILPIADGSENP
ncbi:MULTISPECIES: sensor histidine kinase [unclassified Agrobacterium]|uniref:sensor histidine kinase n=1 Tax=unclassified Agrobacterium TaxID=2632611 RepID=UPI00083CFCE9|nr:MULTISPECIES: ATP-binding protein [unclassified Agrobacterium]AOG09569.1 HAMP domain protein [Agrobacterium sp. RAC06]QGG91995.1 HAMP domain-containing protein [Agrobacterium sp. MA01]